MSVVFLFFLLLVVVRGGGGAAAFDWSERVTIRNAVHGHFSMPRFIGRGGAPAVNNETLVRRMWSAGVNLMD